MHDSNIPGWAQPVCPFCKPWKGMKHVYECPSNDKLRAAQEKHKGHNGAIVVDSGKGYSIENRGSQVGFSVLVTRKNDV